jgi:TIR domain
MAMEIRDVFLSHATSDKTLVQRLAQRIQSEEIEGRKLSCWLDEAEINGSVPGAINDGLERSRFFAAIMTPSYFNSQSGWTDAEWHAALNADPDNRTKRFLPILAASCPHIPALVRHFRWFDLRDGQDTREFKRLLDRLRGNDEPISIQRGRQIDSLGSMSPRSIVAERAATVSRPDQVDERLTCNLLPITEFPTWIYSVPLSAETRRHFGAHVSKKGLCDLIEHEARKNEERGRRIPQFRLSGDQIYSFYPPNKNHSIFRPVIAVSKCTRRQTADYLRAADDRSLLISLLNMTIQSHARSLGLLHSYEPGRGWRFFFPAAYGKRERHIDWIPSRKRAQRTVAKPLRSDDPRTEWLHPGVYLDIVELAGNLFLKIRPTWLVTLDGRVPKAGLDVGRIVNKWTNRERNLSILYHIRFWTTILRVGQKDIEARAHGGILRIADTPAQLELPYGIANDRINPETLLDVEAKLINESEHELVTAAIDFLMGEEWDGEVEDESSPQEP